MAKIFALATKLVSLCICKYIDENMTSKSTWPIVNYFLLDIHYQYILDGGFPGNDGKL